MKALFVSDCHIHSGSDDQAKRMIKLLGLVRETPEVTHVFWMGDIFDLWIGKHNYFIEEYQSLIDEVCQVCESGRQFYYFEGNHDLYLGDFWTRLGVKVVSGPTRIQWEGLRLYLEHGDQTNPKDYGYRFLRAFLRNFLVRKLIALLPNSFVVKVGQTASAHSRAYTSGAIQPGRERAHAQLIQHAKDIWLREPFDLILNGHVHHQLDYKCTDQSWRAINLGVWTGSPNYFLLNSAGDGDFFSIDRALRQRKLFS